MRLIITAMLSLLLIVGCVPEESREQENVLADGNVTEEEADIMQAEWCDYNEGRDFAAEQCEEYWEESSE